MPMTAPIAKPRPPEASTKPRARKIDLSKEALAERLVAGIAPHLPPFAEEPAKKKERPVSQPVAADSASALRDESESLVRPAIASELRAEPVTGPLRQAPSPKAAAPKAATKPASDPPLPAANFIAGYEMLSDALAQAHEVARQTALQMADTRLQTATSLIALQQKLLEAVHSNLNASFAMAQKIVATPNLGDAMALHRRFAQDQVLALTEQAAELRKLSTTLAEQSQAPWAQFWRVPTKG